MSDDEQPNICLSGDFCVDNSNARTYCHGLGRHPDCLESIKASREAFAGSSEEAKYLRLMLAERLRREADAVLPTIRGAIADAAGTPDGNTVHVIDSNRLCPHRLAAFYFYSGMEAAIKSVVGATYEKLVGGHFRCFSDETGGGMVCPGGGGFLVEGSYVRPDELVGSAPPYVPSIKNLYAAAAYMGIPESAAKRVVDSFNTRRDDTIAEQKVEPPPPINMPEGKPTLVSYVVMEGIPREPRLLQDDEDSDSDDAPDGLNV